MQASPQPVCQKAVDPLHAARLLPVQTAINNFPVTCYNCGYVNERQNNFCTNCGYPQMPGGDGLALYTFRQRQRQQIIQQCKHIVLQARGTLYVMALICLIGSTLAAGGDKVAYLRAAVMLMLSGGYFMLARWSVQKPFSAMLVSFLMLISFMAINTWAQFKNMLTSGAGLLLLMVQLVVFYFIYRGVKAAWQVDILEEEERV